MRSVFLISIELALMIVVAGAFASCVKSRQSSTSEAATSSPGGSLDQRSDFSSPDDEMIAESVFRYQLELEQFRLRGIPLIYFLSLGNDKDPTEEFLKRFKNSPYPVKKISESVYQDRRVTERKTGQRGIRLKVFVIKRTSRPEVEVEAEWFAGHGDFQEQVFLVRKENGAWSVSSMEVTVAP